MRAFVAVALLSAMALPAAAGDCYRSYRGHGSHHYARSSYRYHYHRPVYRYSRSYHHRHRAGYRSYGTCYPVSHRRHYSYACGHGYAAYRPYLSYAPFHTRYTTVLTLDDALFDGTEAGPSFDGLPQTRAEPVGSRFLVDAR